jgi:hypothetical protein
MNKIGLLLISVSFLIGAYLTALDTKEVNWLLFVPSLLVGFVGVALVHYGNKQAAQDEKKVTQNMSLIVKSLANLVTNVSYLCDEKENIDTYDMHKKLDDLLIDDLNDFVEARETIAHLYGLQVYAEVMNHFAAGERYLNRVWAASADGYIDEVNDYIEKAREQFVTAKQIVDNLKK